MVCFPLLLPASFSHQLSFSLPVLTAVARSSSTIPPQEMAFVLAAAPSSRRTRSSPRLPSARHPMARPWCRERTSPREQVRSPLPHVRLIDLDTHARAARARMGGIYGNRSGGESREQTIANGESTSFHIPFVYLASRLLWCSFLSI